MSESPSFIAADDPEWCAGCGQKHSKCECAPACRCATLRPGDDCPAHPFDPTQYRSAGPVSAEPTTADRELIAAALRSEMTPGTGWDHRDVDDLADALMAHAIPTIRAAAREEGLQEGERIRAAVEALADEWMTGPEIIARSFARRLRAAVAPAQPADDQR